MFRIIGSLLFLCSMLAVQSFALPSDSCIAGSTRLTNGSTLYFRLFVPRNYSTQYRYPLVMCLHGIGERGSNNRDQIDREEMSHQWMLDSVKTKYKPFVLYPQCPANEEWVNYMSGTLGYSAPAGVGAVKVIDSLIRVYPIDTTRLYIGGLSWGGMGTQGIMTTYPTKFAAAFPCAGINRIYIDTILAKTPFWTHHGSADPTVNVSGSRDLCTAVERAGKKVIRFVSSRNMANPSGISVDSLRRAVVAGAMYMYSEITNGNHADGWMEAFFSPLLVPWLMSKSKVNGQNVFTWPALGPRAVTAIAMKTNAGSITSGAIRVVNGIVSWNGVVRLPAQLSIYTANGTCIMQKRVSRSNGSLACSSMAKGVYLIEINARDWSEKTIMNLSGNSK